MTTPLHQHLANRNTCRTAGRMRRVGWAEHLSGGARDWAVRKIWGKSLRHMRPLQPGVLFDVSPEGVWKVMWRGESLAGSEPLGTLIPEIGRPVSVVATGPSAKDHPWDEILSGGRYVIAVNGAPTYLKKLGISSDLLVVTDPNFAVTGLEHFRNASGVPLVLTWRALAVLAEKSPEELRSRRFSVIERVNSWYGVDTLPLARLDELNQASGSPFLFPEGDRLDLKVGWSREPELGFFSGCTVVSAALQVAVGRGAKDLEIIGMDLSGQGRIYEEGGKSQPSGLEEQYQQYILPQFTVMHQALSGTDVRVRNLSPVCPLPSGLFSE